MSQRSKGLIVGQRLIALWLILGLFSWVIIGCSDSGKKKETTPRPAHYEDEQESQDDGALAMKLTPEHVEEIQRVFSLGRIAVERCFQEFVNRKEDPKLEGTLIVGVKIGLNPNPSKAWIFSISPKIKDETFTQCVLEEAKKWSFPTWGKEMEFMSPKYELLGL